MTTEDAQAAVTQALYLALTAPDYERAVQAVTVAQELASGLTEFQLAACKRAALAKADA